MAAFAGLERLIHELAARLAPGCEDHVLVLGQGARSFVRAAAARGCPIVLDGEDSDARAVGAGVFDLVVSLFDVHAPENSLSMARTLCRAGGRIVFVDWVPTGFAGEIVCVVEHYLPPPPGRPTTFAPSFGAEDSGGVATESVRRGAIQLRAPDSERWLASMRRAGAPLEAGFAALGTRLRSALERDLLELVARFDCGTADEGVRIPVAWREFVMRGC
jgi:SAM-dependent methyltransferase